MPAIGRLFVLVAVLFNPAVTDPVADILFPAVILLPADMFTPADRFVLTLKFALPLPCNSSCVADVEIRRT